MVGSTKYWYSLKDNLKDKFHIILIDLLGFGKSPKDKKFNYTLEEHLGFTYKTIEQINLKSFTLVGHSMGALLALNYAAKFPKKVKRLILLAPPIFKNPKEAKENVITYSSFPKYFLYGKSAQIICKLLCNFLRPLTKYYMRKKFNDLPKEVADDSLLHNYQSYSKSLQNLIENQNTFEIIKDISCPVLIIYGSLDGRAIKANYKLLASLNPKVKLIEVAEGKHDLVYTHQQEILKELED